MSLRFSPTWAGGRPAPPHDTSRGLLVYVVPSTTVNFYTSQYLNLDTLAVLFQSEWRLRTFASNTVYKEACSLSRSSDARSITITGEWHTYLSSP